ncbi:hybrid sensor histidine kinase/response regulator [Methylomonas sp. HW2-6]|uniref:ATP-binding response regulator n=1 Tax=Methylomonas sp. HW2-6 TaxID=3376687 RepID=UPI0040424845
MSAIESKYRNEIEVERLWVTTVISNSVLLMLPFPLLIVIDLWHTAPHNQLLAWFAFSSLTHLSRWSILHYYRSRKQRLAANITLYKMLVLSAGALTSLGWILCIVLFLDIDDPANVLLVCLPPIIQAVGAMMSWFAYYPAVLMLSIPIGLTFVFELLYYGGEHFVAAAITISFLPLLSYYYTQKFSNMLNHALELSFENVALRQESEEKSTLLETALENMGQGIAMSDENDGLRMWNARFSDTLAAVGCQVEPGTNLAQLLAAANPPLPVSAQGPAHYHLPGGPVYEILQVLLRHGGRVITFTDISNLIKRELALENARRDAERANAAKTRFLAAASHDLRQPIHALGLFFGELSERVRGENTAHLIDRIDDAIDAVNSMLSALLDVSKLDAGVVTPELQACDLAELFERLHAEFQPLAQENRNTVRFRPGRYPVATDPAMLERMLRNLIGNALRYTENGRVLVGTRLRGAELEIQVIDTGRGIPEDQLHEVFVEFHQLHNAGRNRRQGLGLGLAIVKRLARLLGHPLQVRSALGKGSCFSLRMPLALKSAPRPAQAQTGQPLLATSLLTGKQVLLLDDDSSVLESMSGLLSRWGCRVLAAASLSQALDELARADSTVDLLITDYRLADSVSGIDFARDLRETLGYRFEVLVVTGDTCPERLREADASGFPLLHKPVNPAKLRATLQHLLGAANVRS